jgi:Ca2+-binding RTX toxin-like protein
MSYNDIYGMDGNDYIAVGHYDSQANTYQLGEMNTYNIISGGDGQDTLAFDGTASTDALDNVTSIEYILLGSSAVSIQTTPDALVDNGGTLIVDGGLASSVTFWGYQDTNSHFYMIGGDGTDYLKGSLLSDTLFGGAGNDCLSGQGGDDTIFGTGGGNDTMVGGDGNDAFALGTELYFSDQINGGDGDDSLYFEDNQAGTDELNNVSFVENVYLYDVDNHIVYTGSGQDDGQTITILGDAVSEEHSIIYSGATANKYQSVIGGAGEDDITTGVLDDTLEGGGGADILRGGDGDDAFIFNTGDVADGEEIYGGAGTDRFEIKTSTDFYGAAANDDIEELGISAGQTATFDFGMESFIYDLASVGGDSHSSATAETIVVNDINGVDSFDLSGSTTSFLDWDSNDKFIINGLDGNDVIVAWDNKTYIDGGDGEDNLSGGAGHDTILGGNDDDVIDGGGGNDSLLGGSGDDVINGGDDGDIIMGGAGADVMSGGTGFDYLSYENDTVGITINLTTGVGTGGEAEGDDVTAGDFEGVLGGSGGDNIYGTTGNEAFYAYNGNDVIDGAGGMDTINGMAGDDRIVISAAVVDGTFVDGGDDTDTLEIKTDADFTGTSSVNDIESIVFNVAEAVATFKLADLDAWELSGSGTGTTETVAINGTTGNDVINLAPLTFTADWELDLDLVSVDADTGDDLILASASAEDLNGGGGFDTVSYNNSTAAVNVNLFTGNVSGGFAAYDMLMGVEGIIGSTYGDTLVGGDDISNYLAGDDGDDRFEMASGTLSDDTLDGGEGDDSLYLAPDGNPAALSHVTGIEHIILSDGTANLVGHDNLADYLSTFTLDATALAGGNSLTWDGSPIANFHQNIIGSDAGDSINGGSNNDTLSGGLGQDSLEGGTGCDVIDGGGNDQTLRQLDVAVYENESQAINANLVTGRVTSGGNTDTLTGIEGVSGTAFNDTFLGDSTWTNIFVDGGGSDNIDGGSVHNEDTGFGFDVVSYEYASEGIIATMTGTSGTVEVDGETDTLTNIDMVWASNYDDELYGDGGDQEFMPGLGSDMVDGGGSEDWDSVTYWAIDSTSINVEWSAGDNAWHVTDAGTTWSDWLSNIESIEGTAGDDTFIGGDGDDYFMGWAGADDFTGGNGMDTVSYEEDPNAVTVLLGDGTATDGWGNTESLSSIEGIEGSAYDDELRGNAVANRINGNDGNDQLYGGGGEDTLSGDAGNDIFFVQSTPHGGTVYDGGDDTDTLQIASGVDFSPVSAVIDIEAVSIGTGSPVSVQSGLITNKTWDIQSYTDSAGFAALAVIMAPGDSLDLTGLTFSSWETGDAITVLGSTASDVIQGSSQVDSISGGDSNDMIFGNCGNDVLIGGAGSDQLNGDAGNDLIMAYGGLDTSTGVNSSDQISGGDGEDTLTDTASVDFSTMTITGIEVIAIPEYQQFTFAHTQVHEHAYAFIGSADTSAYFLGTLGDDTLNLSNLDVTNMLGHFTAELGDGDDVFYGSAMADSVDAGPGDDFLMGFDGNDTLMGGPGQDFLQGLNGDDNLTGGDGADRFVYSYGAAINLSTAGDEITDFQPNTDMIHLTGDLADTPLLWFDTVVVGGVADDQPILVYDSQANVLYYDEKPQDADPNWQGVVATLSGGSLAMMDVFAENQTITNQAGGLNWAGDDNDNTYAGTAADERLFGDGGDDDLSGGGGWDFLIGGEGVDSYDGGADADTIGFSYDADGVTVNLDDGTAIDGWGNAETFSNIENAVGSAYDDVLIGDSGQNMLNGSGGADYLSGMDGMDMLSGGQGSDTFAFQGVGGGTDSISDFDAGTDKIGLNSTFFDFFSGGVFNADNFAYLDSFLYENGAVSFGNGETSGLIYASESGAPVGYLYYDADTGSSGNETLLAEITEMNGTAMADNDLTASSFVEAMV